MGETKKSFVLYNDLIHVVKELTLEQGGNLFKSILQYQNNENPEIYPELRPIFVMIKAQFDRDNEKWEKIRKIRAIAGSKGGKQKVAKASKRKQNLANQAVNVNVNVNDNVNVNVNNKYSLQFEKWWLIYPIHFGYLKEKTFSVWKQNKLDSFVDDIIKNTEMRINLDVHWKDKKFIPYPRKYLEMEIWKDTNIIIEKPVFKESWRGNQKKMAEYKEAMRLYKQGVKQ